MTTTPTSHNMASAVAEPLAPSVPVVHDNRRDTGRTPTLLSARLLSLGCTDAITCATENVSESGMYVRVPTESGLCVGMRYEVMLTNEAAGAHACNLAGDGCYATVVRTERIAHDAGELVGAALRFDHPLFL